MRTNVDEDIKMVEVKIRIKSIKKKQRFICFVQFLLIGLQVGLFLAQPFLQGNMTITISSLAVVVCTLSLVYLHLSSRIRKIVIEAATDMLR